MNRFRNQSVRLLIVDDSRADRTLFRVAFKKSPIPVDLRFCESGKMALELLFPQSGRRTFMPTVCLLDFKMPAVSGRDVLSKIKSDEATRHISVYMLSSSDNEEDVRESFKYGASGYFQKPRRTDELDRMVSSLVSLWSGASRFPNH